MRDLRCVIRARPRACREKVDRGHALGPDAQRWVRGIATTPIAYVTKFGFGIRRWDAASRAAVAGTELAGHDQDQREAPHARLMAQLQVVASNRLQMSARATGQWCVGDRLVPVPRPKPGNIASGHMKTTYGFPYVADQLPRSLPAEVKALEITGGPGYGSMCWRRWEGLSSRACWIRS